jgi:DNA uptake protein ComE-like DNA-binding protein
MGIRSIRCASIRFAQPHLVKLRQISALGMLLSVLVLSGCNSKTDSSSTTSPSTEKSSQTTPVATPAATTAKIDVNSASIAELDKLELPGTKPSLSERIQGKRPYANADDLVTKKAISADELKLIKGLIVVGKAK